jgi:hypothetical protein
MNTIYSTIYPEVNQLKMFTHPDTGLTYQFLSTPQLMELAERALELLLSMGIDQVIVSEAGAVPFARICAWLAWKKNLPLRWYAVKVPRNVSETAHVTLQTYSFLSLNELLLFPNIQTNPIGFSFTRTNGELGLYDVGWALAKQDSAGPMPNLHLPIDYFTVDGRTLGEILESIQEHKPNPITDYLQNVTQTCALAQLLKKPFIFFDEYIDSGTTLFQSFRFFNLFAKDLQFKIFSYLIKIPKHSLDQKLCRSLYTLDDEYQAYQWGVYPFENRMDWLGYYYFITTNQFSKVSVSELFLHKGPDTDWPYLVDFLESLGDGTYLSDLQTECPIPQVAQFISRQHIIQFSLYLLEEIHCGKSKYSEFLFQLFDLYGPIWSPFPDDYHMSYLNAFAKIRPKMELLLTDQIIAKNYLNSRSQIVHHSAELFEQRRLLQQQNLFNALESVYGSAVEVLRRTNPFQLIEEHNEF